MDSTFTEMLTFLINYTIILHAEYNNSLIGYGWMDYERNLLEVLF